MKNTNSMQASKEKEPATEGLSQSIKSNGPVNEFDWIPFYNELAVRILAYRNKQSELIKFLKQVEGEGIPVISLNDRDANGSSMELNVMDPFTFFACFNRGITDKNRKHILEWVKKRFAIQSPVPSNFAGIPLLSNMQSWFFPYSDIRKDEDIEQLWNLAEQCLKEPFNINPATYEYCLKIKSVGIAKLTIGMYWLNPQQYFSLDSVNREYLVRADIYIKLDEAGIYEGYMKILQQINKVFNGSPYNVISRNAYHEKLKQINYWAGGYHWGEDDMSEDFLKNGYWRIGCPVDHEKGKPFYKLINEIKENDVFALKSLGGNHTVDIKAIGVVTDASERSEGVLKISWVNKGNLYHGPAPKGRGSGNWFGTLTKVNRAEDIKMLFDDYLDYNSILYEYNPTIIYLLKNKENKTPSKRAEKMAQVVFDHLREISGDQKGNIFGLFGNWGRGKSFLFSLVKNLNKQQDEPPFRIVEFSAWRYQETPSIWAYLYEELSKDYYGDDYWHALDSRIYLNILRLNWHKIPFLLIISIILLFVAFALLYSPWILSGLMILPLQLIYNLLKGNKTAVGIIKKIRKKTSYEKILGVQAEIQKDIKILLEAWEQGKHKIPLISSILKPNKLLPNQRILLFIDDIDRCCEDKVVEIIDSLRIMLDDEEISKKVVAVAAVDDRMLRKAIENKIIKFDDGSNPALVKEYFDKLFIAGVKLPELKPEESNEIMNLMLKDYLVENYKEEVIKNVQDDEGEIEDINTEEPGSPEDSGLTTKSGNNRQKTVEKEPVSSGIKESDLSLTQQNALRKCVSYCHSMSPRQIRIFFYRYLLMLNILNAIKDEESRVNTESELFPYLLLLRSFPKNTGVTFTENGYDIIVECDDRQFRIRKPDIEIIKEALDMVVAY